MYVIEGQFVTGAGFVGWLLAPVGMYSIWFG